ncbi:hypothetical protein STEG23_030523 [Scotinomys teguina]
MALRGMAAPETENVYITVQEENNQNSARTDASVFAAALSLKASVATTPKRKVSDGAAKAEPKQCFARLLSKPAPAKVDAKPKKAAGKDKSSDKKVQTKGKRGAKGKQTEVADQQTTDVPAEDGETENQSPASEGEEKDAKAD